MVSVTNKILLLYEMIVEIVREDTLVWCDHYWYDLLKTINTNITLNTNQETLACTKPGSPGFFWFLKKTVSICPLRRFSSSLDNLLRSNWFKAVSTHREDAQNETLGQEPLGERTTTHRNPSSICNWFLRVIYNDLLCYNHDIPRTTMWNGHA